MTPEIRKYFSSLGKKSQKKSPTPVEQLREMQRKSVESRLRNKEKKLSMPIP